MATGDIKIIDRGGHASIPTKEFQTAAASTAIYSGEPTMTTTLGSSQYIAVLTDGKPLIDTDTFTGIAAKAGTHTSALAGVCEVFLPLPGLIYSGKAKSTTAVDTQSEIDALNFKRVFFDLTSSSYTVDTAATDAVANPMIIIGGDPDTYQVHFFMNSRGTILGDYNV